MKLKFIEKVTLIILAVMVCGGLCTAFYIHYDKEEIDVIVIDAGHGGHDGGAPGTGKFNTTEKHIALEVSKKLGSYINEYLPDVKVIYTRNKDKYIKLHERSKVANKNKADLFVSIHCNSNNSSQPHGTSTYTMGMHVTEENLSVAKRENSVILLEEDYKQNYDGFDPNSPIAHILLANQQSAYIDNSLKIASMIENQFEERVGRRSLGVKQAGFLVLHQCAMPSVLVEIGFISNPKEEKFLNDDLGQTYISSAIFRAIRDYKTIIDEKN